MCLDYSVNDVPGRPDLQYVDCILVANTYTGLERKIVSVPRTSNSPVAQKPFVEGTPLVGAPSLQGVPCVVRLDQRHGLFPDRYRMNSIDCEIPRPTDANPCLFLFGARSVRLGDRKAFIVFESTVPVAAVAEGLVAGCATAAQSKMLLGCAFPERLTP